MRLSDNLTHINKSLEAVRSNQIELERHAVWTGNIEKRLDLLENKINLTDRLIEEWENKSPTITLVKD